MDVCVYVHAQHTSVLTPSRVTLEAKTHAVLSKNILMPATARRRATWEGTSPQNHTSASYNIFKFSVVSEQAGLF